MKSILSLFPKVVVSLVPIRHGSRARLKAGRDATKVGSYGPSAQLEGWISKANHYILGILVSTE